MFKLTLLLALLFAAQSSHAYVKKEEIYVNCGGRFEQFKESFKLVASQRGYSRQAINAVLDTARYDEKVLVSSRQKGVFKQNFSEFYNKRVQQGMLTSARQKLQQNARAFDEAERLFGVAKEVLAIFWGLETSFGAVQGDFNTVSALTILSHDCARPQLFQPQLMAAIELAQMNALNPQSTIGAWAGEIGQFQFLPQNIIDFGVDGDGDGRVDLRSSSTDAILSAAKMLQAEGWQSGQPWVEEVLVTTNAATVYSYSGLGRKLSRSEWQGLGVRDNQGRNLVSNPNALASLLAPEGERGSVFLVYDNFEVFLKWNQSLMYTLSAANMANSIRPGVQPLQARVTNNGLSTDQLVKLQVYLQSLGYNVGEADGILGAGTRSAVQQVQAQKGWIQDGWPTVDLFFNLELGR